MKRLWPTLANGLGVFSLIAWIVIIATGTYAQFGLPHRTEIGQGYEGCYFTDALLPYVACSPDGPDAQLLTSSWMLSWGVIWLIGFLPYSLLSPVFWFGVVTAFFAIRIIAKTFRGRSKPT